MVFPFADWLPHGFPGTKIDKFWKSTLRIARQKMEKAYQCRDHQEKCCEEIRISEKNQEIKPK
jgi:hypothetical protein